MMAALLEQVADKGLEGIDPYPPALKGGIEKNVEPGVPVVEVGLLSELDQADDIAVEEDGQTFGAGIVFQREIFRNRSPPGSNLGLPDNRAQCGGISRDERSELDELAAQLHESTLAQREGQAHRSEHARIRPSTFGRAGTSAFRAKQ